MSFNRSEMRSVHVAGAGSGSGSGTLWRYRTEDSLAFASSSTYFLPFADNLAVGDKIDIIQYTNLNRSNEARADSEVYQVAAKSGSSITLNAVGSGGGGATNLDGLTDVIVSGPTTGQVLTYNGSNWANDLIVTSSITSKAVSYAKIQDVSATDRILGRASGGAGQIEEITCTSAARSILDDATVGDIRTTLAVAAYETGTWTPATYTGFSVNPSVVFTYYKFANIVVLVPTSGTLTGTGDGTTITLAGGSPPASILPASGNSIGLPFISTFGDAGGAAVRRLVYPVISSAGTLSFRGTFYDSTGVSYGPPDGIFSDNVQLASRNTISAQGFLLRQPMIWVV